VFAVLMARGSQRWYFLGWFCCLLFVVACAINQQPVVFLTTVSPNKTYSVQLKREKGMPLPNHVRADVLKSDRLFQSDIWLHTTGDSSDMTFEAGYPDFRWLHDNIVEFYRKQYFDMGTDSVEVQNKTSRSIRYLHLESLNKFLVFDVQPGSSTSLEVPAPHSDSQWIAVEGTFSDSDTIKFSSRSFDRRSSQPVRSFYEVLITESGAIIEEKRSVTR
jgi:hypothetical protein